jgi:hypothetical protein
MVEKPITFIQIHVLHTQSFEVRRTTRASLSLCASPVEHQFLISVTAHSRSSSPVHQTIIPSHPPFLPPPRWHPALPLIPLASLHASLAADWPSHHRVRVPWRWGPPSSPHPRHTFTNIRSLKPCFEILSQSFLQARSFVAHAFAHRERPNPVNAASIACTSSHATDASNTHFAPLPTPLTSSSFTLLVLWRGLVALLF